MRSYDHIDYDVINGITEITIRRPEKRNAMTSTMFNDLRDCWERFAASDSRAAILKSCDDKVFSAGADLSDPPELFWQGVPELGFKCDKPIIAAISGKAIGAGLILALMCDFIVLTEDAELIYPEAKIGVCKGAVTALIGRAPLRIIQEMILLGDPISATRAYEVGLANRLVASGEHLDEARKIAVQLSENAPLVVEMLKRMTLDTLGDSPIQSFYQSSNKLDKVLGSEDAANALEAFRNKQKPTFNGY